MRHLKKKKVLDRKKSSREALIANLACSLILYEKIKTTDAKAKVLKGFVEKLISRGKSDTLANRRLLFGVLPIKNAVKKIFEVLGPRYQNRGGGYLRIIKLGQRRGDGARIVQLEFI